MGELEELSFDGATLTLSDGRVAEKCSLAEADFSIKINAGKWGTTRNPMKHGFARTYGGRRVYAYTYWKYIKEESEEK